MMNSFTSQPPPPPTGGHHPPLTPMGSVPPTPTMPMPGGPMVAPPPPPNPWILTALEHQQNEGHFVVLRPIEGKISGEQAKPFFLKSGLSPADLAQIWTLADLNKDGKLDRLEFSIAVKLIRNRLAGIPLPPALPDSMKQIAAIPAQQPPPVMPPRPLSAYGSMQGMGSTPNLYSASVGFGGPVAGGPPTPLPPPVQAPVPSVGGGQFGSSYSLSSSSSRPAGKELHDWTIPHNLKLRFSQHFNKLDKGRVGLLTGAQARGVLGESQLPTQMLAQIWTLADVTRDGCLSIEEFCTAMFLIEMVKAGYLLPLKLPPELATFCHRSRTTSPGMGGESPLQDAMGIEQNVMVEDPNAPPPQKNAMPKTFEDKRKDNFDRGQAELERRRQMLMEEERRRREEIERKEREEEERRAREREELERRREMEKQAERLRELERERARAMAEERAKAEREEARRRMEIERLQELEKGRIYQLEQQLAMESEKTHQMEQRHLTMRFQLQALDERAQSLNDEVTTVREEILGITSEIEKMREIRDKKLLKIAELEQKNQSLSVQYERISHESLQLQTECQQSFSPINEANTLKAQISEVDEAIEATQREIELVKEKVAEQEKIVAEKRPEFEESQQKLKEAANEYNSIVAQIHGKQKESSMSVVAEKPELTNKASPPATSNFAGGQFYDFPPQTFEAPKGAVETDPWGAPQKPQQNHQDAWTPPATGAPKSDPFAPPASTGTDPFSAGGGSNGFAADFSAAFGTANSVQQQPQKQEQFETSGGWASFDSTTKAASTTSAAATNDPFAPQPSANQKQPAIANNIPDKKQDSPTKRSGSGTVKTVKYKAKFAFQARSDDELSIQPGDTILVFEGHDAEPGWLAGQIKNKVGWFPAEFAEPMGTTPPPSTVCCTAVGINRKQSGITPSPSIEPLESIKEEDGGEPTEKLAETKAKFQEEISEAFTKTLVLEQQSKQPSTATQQPQYYDFPPPTADSGIPEKMKETTLMPAENEQKTPPSSAEEIVLAVSIAQYQWKARNATELSFARNDVIEILEQGEMRWRGRLKKNKSVQGWFPKSYVRLEKTTTTVSAEVAPADSTTPGSPPTTTKKSPPTSVTSQKRASIAGDSAVAGKNDLYPDLGSTMKRSGTTDGIERARQQTPTHQIQQQQQNQSNVPRYDAPPLVQQNGGGNKENNTSGKAVEMQKSDSKSSISSAGKTTGEKAGSNGSVGTGVAKSGTAAASETGGDWFVALYNFDPVEPTDLRLQAGDRIQVAERIGDWWRGTCRGKSGMFPANYVRSVEELAAASAKTAQSNANSSPAITPVNMVGKALADFSATAANQISLKAGDIVRVNNTSTAGWWEGEVEHDGVVKAGWFPGNYIQVLSTGQQQAAAGAEGKSGSSPQKCVVATALYDYAAQHDDELSFRLGDQIEVLDRSDPQWWRGRKFGGENVEGTSPPAEGLIFPSTYVQL